MTELQLSVLDRLKRLLHNDETNKLLKNSHKKFFILLCLENKKKVNVGSHIREALN